MTGIKKEYELRVFNSTGGSVDFTVASSNMKSAPTINGPAIDLARMRTQARPSQVEILDVDDYFSAKVADSSGRLVLLGRKCDVRVNKDGADMSVLQTGRISDIVDHVSHFNLTFEDERYIERRTNIFTRQDGVPSTNGTASSSHYVGTQLIPASLRGPYGGFRVRRPVGFDGITEDRFGTLRALLVHGADPDPSGLFSPWNESIRNYIKADVKADALPTSDSTTGSFRALRANVDGTDYEIASLRSVVGTRILTDTSYRPAQTALADIAVLRVIWLVDPSTDFGLRQTASDIFLHAPTAEPHPVAPLHVGGIEGMHPVQLVKDLYDAADVRYSSSGVADLLADPSFGRVRFRITEPTNMGTWLEDHIYGPYGLVPFVNSSGEVEPKKIHLQQDVDPDTLFSFTAKNSAAPHPQPHHSGRDMVTAIKFTYTAEAFYWNTPDSGSWPADRIQVTEREIERTHDRLDSSELPRRELRFVLDGVHPDHTIVPATSAANRVLGEADRLADILAPELFERFGDGPLRGTVLGLSTAETVDSGDFASINIPTFLAPSTQGRGAKRIVQITSRKDTPAGPDFEWLDAGPHSQPLSAPEVTVAQATSDPNHVIVATLSSMDAVADRWQLQIGRGTTEPGSSGWDFWYGTGTSSGKFSLGPLGSDNQYWFRARVTAAIRVRSAWSPAASTNTAQIAQPPVSSSTSETATSIKLDWASTAAVLRYPLEVRISSSGKTCPSSSTMMLVSRLGAGSDRFEFRDLTSDSTYCLGVRHYDMYGGVGAERTLTVPTTTVARPLPDMKQKPTIVAGSTCP